MCGIASWWASWQQLLKTAAPQAMAAFYDLADCMRRIVCSRCWSLDSADCICLLLRIDQTRQRPRRSVRKIKSESSDNQVLLFSTLKEMKNGNDVIICIVYF